MTMAKANTAAATDAAATDLLKWAKSKATRLYNSLYAGELYLMRRGDKIVATHEDPEAPTEDGATAPTVEKVRKGDYAAIQARVEATGLDVSAPPGHEDGDEIIVTAKRKSKKIWSDKAGEWVDNPDAGGVRYLQVRRLDRAAQEAWERKMDEQRPSRVKKAVAAI